MKKIVYIDKLFANRREKLIEMCLKLQEQGKRFLYIMPSSAAIFQVRERFNELRGGFLGSRVIVFDDLEMDIVKDKLPIGNIIYEPMDRVIIAEVCRKAGAGLKYYGKICGKKGFHQEVNSFIRSLKRGCMDEMGLLEVVNGISDGVLRDKLKDIQLIYCEYNKALRERDLYDRNDISLMAIELAKEYGGLKGIDTIIIDGFTDFEQINLSLIEEIAALDKVNIVVGSPYENTFSREFLRDEIERPFKKMGFDILREENNMTMTATGFKSLCERFYSGERAENIEGTIKLLKYPCLEAEVRETARSIKNRLIEGGTPGDFGVYVNNSDSYCGYFTEIFKEYGIPLSLPLEIPLGGSELVRNIIKGFGEREEESLTAGQWLDIFDEKISGLGPYMEGLLKAALNGESSQVDLVELKSLDSLRGIGEEMRTSFGKSGMLSNLLTWEYFMDYLIEGISEVKIEAEQGNNRGIRVLNTSLAKGISFKHVYILGLNEGELPSNLKASGLFDSMESEELGKNGVGSRGFLWELTREKLRFNLALSSAIETLTLSYRGAGEDGSFAIASSFVDELRFLTGISEEKVYTMRDRFEVMPSDSMSRSELERGLIREYFRKLYNGGECTEGNNIVDISSALETGRVEYHREREVLFNEYEGIIGESFEKIAPILGKFSPSALGSYLDCPFKYMAMNLYKIGEPEEEEGEYSNLEIGELYHGVLFGYYSNLRQFENLDEDLFERVFGDAYESLRKIELPEEELQRKKGDFHKRLKDFLLLDLERFKNYEKETGGRVLRPHLLEKYMASSGIFGVEVCCKVDRLDLEFERIGDELRPTGRFVIYDYKKNSMPEMKEILQNGDYQLPIYYFLVEEYLKKELGRKNSECMSLLYMSIEATEKENKKRKKQAIEVDGIYKTEYKKALSIGKQWDIKGEHFETVMEYIRGLISETVALIKSGSFNYKPMCEQYEGYTEYECDFKRMCRYSKNKMRRLMEEGQ